MAIAGIILRRGSFNEIQNRGYNGSGSGDLV
jgi:hypothetical protein